MIMMLNCAKITKNFYIVDGFGNKKRSWIFVIQKKNYNFAVYL